MGDGVARGHQGTHGVAQGGTGDDLLSVTSSDSPDVGGEVRHRERARKDSWPRVGMKPATIGFRIAADVISCRE
jgi:hypothetical protein